MKKKIVILGSIALLACAFVFASMKNRSNDLSANKPENLQELLQNFSPGDEAVAYADTLTNPL